jgi:glycosyltransferase involved in cell wall biosynthesis
MPISTLYLCYFGLREPLVQTQVLPYLRRLAAEGVGVHLLTFEPELLERWSAEEISAQQAKLENEGIRWFYLKYHKRPSVPATLYDILAGARAAALLMRRHEIKVLHARAHVPVAMALLVKRLTGCRLVFDIRGLMAEEYADAGIWSESSLTFRAVKRLERAGIRRADQIITLTRRMRDWLVEHRLAESERIEVIPCCVDFNRFKQASETSDEGSERFEVVYAGAITGLYMLEEMGRFFLEIRARRPSALFRVMTMAAPETAEATLKRAGLEARDFLINAVAAAEVPTFLRRARLGLSFRKPTFAQIAASPTKIPEYLAVGLPVVCNAGIGDMDELIEREQVGVVLRDFNEQGYASAAEQAIAFAEDQKVRHRSAQVARQYFDLNTVGGRGYSNVYRRLEEQDAR